MMVKEKVSLLSPGMRKWMKGQIGVTEGNSLNCGESVFLLIGREQCQGPAWNLRNGWFK